MSIEIHTSFKLNGISFSLEGLKEVGYSLVKEGDLFEHHIGDFLLDWCNGSHFITTKTSGSTGKPKHLSLKKQHMVNSALATGEYFNLRPGYSALHCLPTEFIAGKMMLVRAMVLGLDLDYVEPSSRPLDLVEKTYDFCAMVPLQVENSLRKMGQIKKLVVGGAPISSCLKKQVKDKSTKIYETYGMTETSTHVAVKRVNHTAENHFKALKNVKLSTDGRNCLVIEAPHILDNPIATNDIVELISKDEFNWLGRLDNIVNSGGIKLVPEQIEAKLEGTIDHRFFVAGLPDEKLGQKLVMVVEGNIDGQGLLKKVKAMAELEKFEVPKTIYPVSQFVCTPNGKILRAATLRAALSVK